MITEPLKNMFNEQFFAGFTKDLKRVINDFDERKFVAEITDDEWENKEFKQRCKHIATVLGKFLPPNFKDAAAQILELCAYLKTTPLWTTMQNTKDTEWSLLLEYGWILDDFIEQYGIDDYETSVKVIEELTQFTSCEGCVRPFIIKYPEKMMKQMLIWSKHESWAVRRLASEGCRPRLPWYMALPKLKENPASIIPILENLKDDPHFFVRKSVANNLNDIAKDNPAVVIDLIKKWLGKSKNTDWVIKHGSRTLLKQGNPQVLEIFGLGTVKNISIEDFQILTPKVKVGKSLEFSFKLLNENAKKVNIRLEYGIYYHKANGTLSKKVKKSAKRNMRQIRRAKLSENNLSNW